MRLQWRKYRLRLKHTFRISYGSYDHRDAFLLKIEANGKTGFGEAAVVDYYGQTMAAIAAGLEALAGYLSGRDICNPAELWGEMRELAGPDNFCLSAVDCALWDLWGQKHGLSTRRMVCPDVDAWPVTSLTIGGGEASEMEARILETDWPVYKIKCGFPGDLERLQQLRRITGRPFRIDANAGWTLQEAVEKIRQMGDLGLDLIEQPLPPSMDGEMSSLQAVSTVPLIADESCRREEDVRACAGRFDGINIKLLKCGGITPALRMIREARQLGMQVMIGCMTESSVGISASAQLIPLVDYIDLDGFLLISNDPAEGIGIENGVISFPPRPGHGILWKNE